MSTSDLHARFQPYVLSMLDSRSLGGFATRHVVTFPTRQRKYRFILFLRRKCHARRRGNWASIPGHALITRAIDYAANHGSYVFNLSVKKTPIHRRWVAGDEEDGDIVESEDENVAEEDILSGAEDL